LNTRSVYELRSTA